MLDVGTREVPSYPGIPSLASCPAPRGSHCWAFDLELGPESHLLLEALGSFSNPGGQPVVPELWALVPEGQWWEE